MRVMRRSNCTRLGAGHPPFVCPPANDPKRPVDWRYPGRFNARQLWRFTSLAINSYDSLTLEPWKLTAKPPKQDSSQWLRKAVELQQ